MKLERRDAAWALAGLAFCVALWWPTRELPYHWDGAMFVARGARGLLARDFTPFVVGVGHFAHPPLFVAALALCWKVFGESRLVSHLLVFPFLPLLLASTYALGSRLYARSVGAAAAALVAFTAVVVAEYGQIYSDLPLAAVLTCGLALWLAERRLAAAALFCVAAAIKIPSLVFPCALIAAAVLRRERMRALWPLLLPFAVVAAWLVYHHAVEGFWLTRPGRRSHMAGGGAEFARNLWLVLERWLDQQRWTIALAGVAAGTALLVRARAAGARAVLGSGGFTLLCVLAAGLCFFALTGEFAQRYGIMLLPPLYVLCAAAVRALVPHSGAYALAVALGCALLARAWVPSDAPTRTAALRPDEDLGYLDMIALGRELGALLERQHPNAAIYGSVPESYWLTEPFQGYVTRPFPVALCREFRPDMPGEKLVIAHLYSREFRDCLRLIQATSAPPIAKLSHGGKWLQVHALP